MELNISLAGSRYFGAICIYDKIFNEEEYLSLSKHGKYKYILDLLHFAVWNYQKLMVGTNQFSLIPTTI
jgi:hypothetical protein